MISKSDLDQLKKDVFKTASPGQVEELEKLGIIPSSNDCLVALMYMAFIETRPDVPGLTKSFNHRTFILWTIDFINQKSFKRLVRL